MYKIICIKLLLSILHGSHLGIQNSFNEMLLNLSLSCTFPEKYFRTNFDSYQSYSCIEIYEIMCIRLLPSILHGSHLGIQDSFHEIVLNLSPSCTFPVIICTSFISSIDNNVFIVLQCHLRDHVYRKVT